MTLSRDRLLLLVAALLLLALAGVVMLRTDTEIPVGEGNQPTSPELIEGQPSRPEPVDAKPLPDKLLPGNGPAPVGQSAGDALRLRMVIQPLASLRPELPSPPRCFLYPSPESEPIEGRFVAGSLTRWHADPDDSGPQLAEFSLPAAQTIYRLVVRDQQTGQWRTDLGRAEMLRGQVVDEAGNPIAKAALWLGGSEAQTNDLGQFEVQDVPLGSLLPAVVQATGRASLYRKLTPTQCREFLTFTLAKGGSLQVAVRVKDPEVDLSKGRLIVLPADQARTTDMLSYPFFMQGLTGGFALDNQGIVSLEGLPARGQVWLRLMHDDLRQLQDPRSGLMSLVRLAQQSMLELPAEKIPSSQGQVQDEAGVGIPATLLVADDVELWSWRTSGALTGLLLPGAAYNTKHRRAECDADGNFTLSLPHWKKDEASIHASAPGKLSLQWTLLRDLSNMPDKVCLPAARELQPPLLQLVLPQPEGRSLEIRVEQEVYRLGQDISMKILQDWVPWSGAAPFSIKLGQPIVANVLVYEEGSDRIWTFADQVLCGEVSLPLER